MEKFCVCQVHRTRSDRDTFCVDCRSRIRFSNSQLDKIEGKKSKVEDEDYLIPSDKTDITTLVQGLTLEDSKILEDPIYEEVNEFSIYLYLI